MTDFGDYDSDAISKESWFKLLEAWCLAHSERNSYQNWIHTDCLDYAYRRDEPNRGTNPHKMPSIGIYNYQRSALGIYR